MASRRSDLGLNAQTLYFLFVSQPVLQCPIEIQSAKCVTPAPLTRSRDSSLFLLLAFSKNKTHRHFHERISRLARRVRFRSGYLWKRMQSRDPGRFRTQEQRDANAHALNLTHLKAFHVHNSGDRIRTGTTTKRMVVSLPRSPRDSSVRFRTGA